MTNDMTIASVRQLPPDDPRRVSLHDEIHARPSPLVQLPALVTCVALDNRGIDTAAELERLCALAGAAEIPVGDADINFLSVPVGAGALRWERHTEFTRYTLIQPDPMTQVGEPLPVDWTVSLPGRVLAAVRLEMVEHDLTDAQQAVAHARARFGENAVVASRIGNEGHSCAVTDLRIDPSGFERIVVMCRPGTSPTRAGRLSQRLLELEIYRVLALHGLPAAKTLAPELNAIEADMALAVRALEQGAQGTQGARADKDLLRDLTGLAARLERATTGHDWRFAATAAYDALVRQRIAELRETAVSGTQTLGEFLQRRLSPAMATVAATVRRLDNLGARVERTTALLRTRVDIATEEQNQALLAQLTRGQSLQLRLQATVEGLSIAAISYYIVSLLLYGGKAAKAAGWRIDPEIAAGAAIPLVVWAVWRGTRRIHRRLTALS